MVKSYVAALEKAAALLLVFLLGSSALARAEIQYPLIYEACHSAVEGANNLLTLHRLIYGLEEKLLKPKFIEEKTLLKKALGISYRLSKTIFIDNVVDHMTFLVQHEFFGHGARYREFGYVNNRYELHLVYPYGDNKGWAFRGEQKQPRIVTDHENMVMKAGGSEANCILSNILLSKWLQRGSIHYREAILYLFAANDLNQYILFTKFGLRNRAGNDVLNFLSLINAYEGYAGESNYRLTLDDLGKHTLANFLNPFFYYALYTYLYTYLWSGENAWEFPLIKLRGMKYLPCFRMGLTPFGSELYFENFFLVSRQVFRLYFRYGIPTFHTFWGAGVNALSITLSDNLSLQGELDVWYQPQLLLGGDSVVVKKTGFGAALLGTVHFRPIKSKFPLHLFTQVGYKSKGFLPGEKLSAGLIIRAGLSLSEM
ncbi:MAG: hypothetical protein ACE5LC_00945 [Candidatus Aminicenantales bacterium]